jgi:FAD synthetase
MSGNNMNIKSGEYFPDNIKKLIIKFLYKNYLLHSPLTIDDLSRHFDFLTSETLNNNLKELESRGLVKLKNGKTLLLTESGRKALRVIFVGGAFQIIHPGHVYTLKTAKSLGDFLVVSVARDSTIRERRKKDPLNDENARRDLVSSIRYVDAAILGSETDIYETVKFVKPDVIALGYDQQHDERQVKEASFKKGVSVEVVRLDSPIPSLKSSSLLKEQPSVLEET